MPPEHSGQFIEQDKPCVDCHKPWGMYESEIDFYKNLIKTKDFKMPRRCPDCRSKKRDLKDGKRGPIPLVTIHGYVCKLKKQAEEGAYTFHDEVLANDLKFIIDALGPHVRQEIGKKETNEPTESVSERPQG